MTSRSMSTTIKHSKPTLGIEEESAVLDIFRSGHLARGSVTSKFEQNLADLIGMPYAVAVNSGLSALHLSLRALGVGKGDRVIIPSLVCEALLLAVDFCGAIPIVVDINPEDGNISAGCIRRELNLSNVKAIIVPHMFGCPSNIEEICSLGIPVIEDCAQSIGATIGDKHVGSFGDLSVFSFYATKMICTGEGGAVLCKTKETAGILADLRTYRKRSNYHTRYGYDITDMASAIGIEQLKKLNGFIQRRKEIARYYSSVFNKIPWIRTLSNDNSVFYRYIVLTKHRDSIRYDLEQNGIECGFGVSTVLSTIVHPSCPCAENFARMSLSLPIYPLLTDSEVKHVVESIVKAGSI